MKERGELIVGWREVVTLPDLGLHDIKAKIDTGARTTALHASDIREIEHDGAPHVEFVPDHGALEPARAVRAALVHEREIKNTSGTPERRYIILTRLVIEDREVPIELSLTDRAGMTFPIILGRSALCAVNAIVDPSSSWLLRASHSVQRSLKAL